MVVAVFLQLRNQIRHPIMTIEQLKQRIMAGQQQYFNRDQVMELLDKLEPQKQNTNVLTLF
ncbi:MAG: hypothetical protein ACK528_01235 [Alphaproteobacteria bacterium]